MSNETPVENGPEMRPEVEGSEQETSVSTPSPRSNDGSWSMVLKVSAMVLGVLAVLLADFGAGFYFGSENRAFHSAADRNYMKNFGNFGMGKQHKGMDLAPHDARSPRTNSRGLIGEIVGISGDELALSHKNGTEIDIELSERAVIRKNGKEISAGDLNVGDQVIIIGHPERDEGVFEAKLIRVIKEASGTKNSATKDVN